MGVRPMPKFSRSRGSSEEVVEEKVVEAQQKTLLQLQAEALAEKRFTEMMASAGVGYNQMAKELLYFLPKQFLEAYEQLWYRGFAGKDDGGAGAGGPGRIADEAARVGKASGKGLQGLGGAKRKTYKKYWVIADEQALELKDRMDKRLRSMAREIKDLLIGLDAEENGGKVDRCASCGRILQVGWNHCPFDGSARFASEG